MRKNVAGQIVGAQMTNAADGTPFTGTATCYVCGDGGTLTLGSVGSGVATHEGGGLHNYAPALAETNYNLAQYQFRGTGAITVTQHVYMQRVQPRSNRRPSPGFRTKVSNRADGTYKCVSPIRLTAGAVNEVYVFIDMSPLFGADDFVDEVGTPTVSGGSVTASADSPRDCYAIVELGGTATASEERTVTVPVTMESGTTVDVVFDVEVFD